MKKSLLLVLALAFLVGLLMGCDGDAGIAPAALTQTTVCVEGVSYIVYQKRLPYGGIGFMSVKFNRDSTVALCGQPHD